MMASASGPAEKRDEKNDEKAIEMGQAYRRRSQNSKGGNERKKVVWVG